QRMPPLVTVGVVVNLSRRGADELIEALLERTRPRREADVPFAETAGGITRILQISGNQLLAGRESDSPVASDAWELDVETIPLRRTAGEERGPRWRARRGR